MNMMKNLFWTVGFYNERITCLFTAIPPDARIVVTPYNVFGVSGPDRNAVR